MTQSGLMDLAATIRQVETEVRVVKDHILAINKIMHDLHRDIEGIKAQQNFWKGGVAVLIVMAGLVGWLASLIRWPT